MIHDEKSSVETKVRWWWWFFATSSALVLTALAVWLRAWHDLLFVGFVYVPAVPVALFALLVLVVNPALRRCGAAIRRNELLVLMACWLVVCGVIQGGLIIHWQSTLLAEDVLSTRTQALKDPPPNVYGKPNTQSFKDASPNALSFSARADLDEARLAIQAFQAAQTSEARAESIADYQALDLKQRYHWPAAITSTTEQDVFEPLLTALLDDLRTEERMLQALVSEQVPVSDLWLGNADAELLQELRLTDPNAQLPQVTAVAWDEKPISRLWQPIMQSGWFIFAGILAVFSLLAVTAKQWTDNERLAHPLAQIPATMVDEGWRSPAFRRGFTVMALIWAWQICNANGLSLPMLPLNSPDFLQVKDLYNAPFLGMEIPSSNKWVYNGFWNTIRIVPFVIAVAFLVAKDVGFSVWAGFFFSAMVCGWLYNAGIEVNFMQHGRVASGGALMAFAVVIAYLGRHHYWALIKASIGKHTEASRADRLGVWGVRGIVVLTTFLAMLMYSYSGSIVGTLIGLLFTWSSIVVVARIVAESGLVGIQAQPEINPLLSQLGIASYFPLTAIIVLSYLGSTLVVDTRENIGGFGVQAQQLGRMGGVRSTRFMMVLGGLSCVAAIVAIVFSLMSHVAGPNPVVNHNNPLSMNQWIPAAFNPNENKLLVSQSAFIVGMALVFIIAFCRQIWAGFLFHPIGLIVATSWPIYNLWGSLMLGWVLKVAVLRYGGAHVYTNLKPFAIGIIAADASGFAFEIFLRWLANVNEWNYQAVAHWTP
jgi:hypothetical protein